MRRVLVVAALAGLGVIMLAPSAAGHALLRSSEPADGATVDAAPEAVTIRFTERPDPKVSSVRVLDTAGRPVAREPARLVDGEPLAMRLPLPPLPEGVYTVTWRVLSTVDGHITAGAFAFGVGVSPEGVQLPEEARGATTPPPSPLSIAGRALWYAGLLLLIGGAWVGALAFADPPARLVLWTGWALAVLGLVGIGESQRSTAGISYADLFGSSVGRALLWRAIPVAVALVALVALRARGRLLVAGLAGAGAIVAHVASGHAAAGDAAAFKTAVQSAHFLAGATWIGGLAALLVGIRGAEPDVRARAARRFSNVALASVAVIIGTGIGRSIDEVGSWASLTSTTFGRLVLAKIALLAGLVAFGAVNRYRSIPAVRDTPHRLVRVSRAELALAAVALVVTGALSGVAPAKEAAADAADESAGPVVVEGADFGTTVRVRLTVDPGFPGRNTFTARVQDHDTRAPADATRVALRFAYRGLSEVGESVLELTRVEPGVWRADGANLSLDGPWQITALVQTATDSTEVTLDLRTLSPPQDIEVNEVPGAPTLYTVRLGDERSVQFYVDPGRAGANEVHATFFEGTEEMDGVGDVVMLATPEQGDPLRLAIRRFTSGHFIGRGSLQAGTWRFDVAATAADGTPLTAYFEETIEP